MLSAQSTSPLTKKHLLCAHCQEPVIHAYFDDEDKNQLQAFCCQGCLTVYQVINAKGLEDYYDIKKRAGSYRRRSPVEIQETKYRYMDDREYQNEFTYRDERGFKTMEFYLEGIHC